MRHTYEVHKNCREEHGTCPVCDGGLKHCIVCGGAEASLPTDCPGRRMTAREQDSVQRGDLDYRDGAWIRRLDDL